MVVFGSHDDYITLIPTVSIGRGWVVVDWLFWSIDINHLSL